MGAAPHNPGGFMAATSAQHIVRVTVRISAGAIHRDIDVALPTASTLAEVLPELSRLIDIPQIDRPWAASTAAGAPLDMYTPLHALRLFDGSVITFHPAQPPSPPVVRDAAESLTAAAAGAREVPGLDVAAGAVGAACIGLLAYRATGAPLACAAAALVAFAVAVAAERPPVSAAVFRLVPLAVGAAAGLWVAGPRAQWVAGTDPALGALAAAATSAATVAVGAALGLAGHGTVTWYLTCALLAAAGAAGAWFPAPLAPPAIVILAGLFTVMATPSVATRAAGLHIPRIPTAGEEFSSADGYQADVDQRSARAIDIAAALTCGVAACIVPALAALALPAAGGARSPGWAFALAMSTAGAVALHALRHHYPAPRVALAVIALAAAAACALIAARAPGSHPAMAVAAVSAALLAASAPLWAPHLTKLEPTTVVWFERAETAAIIAAVPLAVQLTGLFAAIRGL